MLQILYEHLKIFRVGGGNLCLLAIEQSKTQLIRVQGKPLDKRLLLRVFARVVVALHRRKVKMLPPVQDIAHNRRLQVGKVQPDLVQEVFEQLELKAAPKSIHLHLKQEGAKGVWVLADRNRIKQVFTNLIDNAIKYGRQNGNIWVSFLDGRKKVQIMVRDDGTGIPKEHQNRIFERFYRIDKSRSRESGSLGLGLAISKHIVEAHRSVILVSSEVGKGTTLRFKLPKALAKTPAPV